jgi:hypothetical protein
MATAPKVEPLPVKKAPPKPTDADDSADAPAASPQRGTAFLPTGLSRAIVIAALLWTTVMVTTSLFAGRYELVPAPSTGNNFMYRLDRLTGAVSFCGSQQCVPIAMKAAAN